MIVSFCPLSSLFYHLTLALMPHIWRPQPVNATDEARRTALHYAAAQGHFDIAELLIRKGADTMARTRENESTPLHDVATGEVAELLIQGKGDVEAADEWDLRCAAKYLVCMCVCMCVRVHVCVY
jgi:hypothetical protein